MIKGDPSRFGSIYKRGGAKFAHPLIHTLRRLRKEINADLRRSIKMASEIEAIYTESRSIMPSKKRRPL